MGALLEAWGPTLLDYYYGNGRSGGLEEPLVEPTLSEAEEAVFSSWMKVVHAGLLRYANLERAYRSLGDSIEGLSWVVAGLDRDTRFRVLDWLFNSFEDRTGRLADHRRPAARDALKLILDRDGDYPEFPFDERGLGALPDEAVLVGVVSIAVASVTYAELEAHVAPGDRGPRGFPRPLADQDLLALHDLFSVCLGGGAEPLEKPLFYLVTCMGRGRLHALLKDARRAVLDLDKAENRCRAWLREYMQEKSSWRIDFYSFCLILADVFRGDARFSQFDYEGCFDHYCGAVRKYRAPGEQDPSSLRLRDRHGPSLEMARVLVQKGKVFLETGHLKRSIQWFLEAANELGRADFGPDTWGPVYREHLEPLRAYLEKEGAAARLDKQEFASLLDRCSARPQDWLSGDPDPEFKCLWSDLLNRMGFALSILRLPAPADRMAQAWLQAAEDADSANVLAFYDLVLMLLRQCVDSPADKAAFEDLRHALDQAEERPATFPNNPGRTVALTFLVEKAFNLLDWRKKRWPRKTARPGVREVALQDIYARLLTDIGNIVTRPEETIHYLMQEGAISREKRELNDASIDRLVVLRRWNSFTPRLPRPRTHSVYGGGYLLVWKGKGVAIDPGFDFIENLYRCGYSIEDIDAIVVTHAHVDHTDDLEALLTLLYERNDYIEKSGLDRSAKKAVELFLNQGSLERFAPWLCAHGQTVKAINSLPPSGCHRLFHDYHLDIVATPAYHGEMISKEFAVGVRFLLYDPEAPDFDEKTGLAKPVFQIAVTGDSGYKPSADLGLPESLTRKPLAEHFAHCDVVCAHLGAITFKELAILTDLKLKEPDTLDSLAAEIIATGLATPDEIAVRLGFDAFEDMRVLTPGAAVPKPYFLRNHLGLGGVLEIIEAMAAHTRDHAPTSRRLLVLTEYPEELGSFRHNLSTVLDEMVAAKLADFEGGLSCLSGDIGLTISLEHPSRGFRARTGRLAIQCCECARDNDLRLEHMFAELESVQEICVKGEAEGMAYYCDHHRPIGEAGRYFVERMSGPHRIGLLGGA